MQRIADSIHLRYGLAILVTSALMIWVSVNERPLDDWSNQIVFWAIAVTAGWLQMILIARGVRASFGVDRYPGWVLWAATALIGAVPLTFQVRWLMDTIVAPSGGLPPPWVTYLNVTVINSVFCLLQYILIERWPLFAPSLEDAGTPQPLPVAEALDASEASEPTSAPLSACCGVDPTV